MAKRKRPSKTQKQRKKNREKRLREKHSRSPDPHGSNLDRVLDVIGRTEPRIKDLPPVRGCGPRAGALEKRAQTLISYASASALGLHQSLGERFPVVDKLNILDWDLFVTVASVFVASTQLNQEPLPHECIDSLLAVVTHNAATWKPDSIAAFEDCKAFYENALDSMDAEGALSSEAQRFQSADAIGAWIVANLLGRLPGSKKEVALIRPLGTLVVHNFSSWWAA